MPNRTPLDAFIAANRFGYGLRGIDELNRIAADPQQWLLGQIGDRRNPGTTITADLPTSSDMIARFRASRDAKDRETMNDFNKDARETLNDEIFFRFRHAVSTDRPFAERLVEFWSNHFTVSGKSKVIVIGLLGAFEREAIRPHVFSTFEDLLLAAERHPAMLQYLDNAQSIGPNSQAGRRRKKGLNENLAREILELHTLGVDGGYTQADVIALAKIITGWTVKPPQIEGKDGFMFVPQMHEPGVKVFLGHRYGSEAALASPTGNKKSDRRAAKSANQSAPAPILANGDGFEEGASALRNLARHPSTARFICTKLARHFIADNPPAAAIAALESVFLRTKGSLPDVYRALIGLNEVWHTPLAKFKPPHDYLVSVFRITGIVPDEERGRGAIMQGLTMFDHMPFMALSPAGWGDTEGDWLSPDALMNRVDWAYSFARQVQSQIADPVAFAKGAIGPATTAAALTAIAQAPSKADAIALVLAAPATMRR